MFCFPMFFIPSTATFCRWFNIVVIVSIPIIVIIMYNIIFIIGMYSHISLYLNTKYVNILIAIIATISIFIAGYTIASIGFNIQIFEGCK